MKDLILEEVIGWDNCTAETGYCVQPSNHPQFPTGPKYYWNWEKEVAIPKLRDLGYTTITSFFDGERDSFGPLSRVVIATDVHNEKVRFIYG